MRLRLRVTAALALLVALAGAQYTPNWASLDTRPLPAWYDEAKFGIFMHWGVYSVPSWGNEEGGASGEWYWWQLDGAKSPDYVRFHNASYGADFRYPQVCGATIAAPQYCASLTRTHYLSLSHVLPPQFAPMFTAELFNATEWAGILRDSGARYVVLTSKHHEGWCNWPAPVTGFDFPWDATATGPGRDLAGELTAAVREAGMHMGFYFSLLEWFNPLYVQDKLANFSTAAYVERIMLPQLQDLVRRYEPAVLWADGHWEAGAEYFASPRFLAWLYNHSPVRDRVVVNDRWGKECGCKHGGFLTCDDRFNPGTLQTRKWENAMTLDRHSWGFRRNAPLEDFLSAGEVLAELVTTVACGGNLLLNFGPTREGTIAPIFQERLRQVGQWMKVRGGTGGALHVAQPLTRTAAPPGERRGHLLLPPLARAERHDGAVVHAVVRRRHRVRRPAGLAHRRQRHAAQPRARPRRQRGAAGSGTAAVVRAAARWGRWLGAAGAIARRAARAAAARRSAGAQAAWRALTPPPSTM